MMVVECMVVKRSYNVVMVTFWRRDGCADKAEWLFRAVNVVCAVW